jgi:hypothetical protein
MGASKKKKTMILKIDNQSKEIKKEECIKYGMDLCIKLAIISYDANVWR